MDDRPPTILKGEARNFWKRNASIMIEDGRLSPSTRDSFIGLCLSYGDWWDARIEGCEDWQIQQLYGPVNKGMEQWGMNPLSYKKLKIDSKKKVTLKDIADNMRKNAISSETSRPEIKESTSPTEAE